MDFEKCMQLAKDYAEEYLKLNGLVGIDVDFTEKLGNLHLTNSAFMEFLAKYKINAQDIEIREWDCHEKHAIEYRTMYNNVEVFTIIYQEEKDNG